MPAHGRGAVPAGIRDWKRLGLSENPYLQLVWHLERSTKRLKTTFRNKKATAQFTKFIMIITDFFVQDATPQLRNLGDS